MLATPVARREAEALLAGGGWVVEPKLDGYRAKLSGSTLTGRNGAGLSENFPEITGVAGLQLDGEIVPVRGSFETVASRAKETPRAGFTSPNPCRFIPFDSIAGGISSATLDQRRYSLEAIRDSLPGLIPQSSSPDFIEQAMMYGLEGVVLKHKLSTYRPGRSSSWRKLKFTQQIACVAYAYEKGTGRRAEIGSVLLGLYTDAGIEHIGSVGTGFTDLQLQRMKEVLDRGEMLPVEVKTLGRTAGGKLRQPVFSRHRPDLLIVDCDRREFDELPTY